MAVNVNYYGTPDTWVTLKTTNGADYIEVKAPNSNPADLTNVNRSSFQYLWGGEYETTGNQIITLDKSFAYIAMDKNAPQNKIKMISAYISNTATNDFYGLVNIAPTKNTPFGWCLNGGAINASVQTQYDSVVTYDTAPVNYKPLWYSPSWLPRNGIANGKYYLRYFGYDSSPVLSMPYYKKLKLVPIIRCYKLKTGKTLADLENITNVTDVNSTIEDPRSYDLNTYLTGKIYVNGTEQNVKDVYPVITQIGCQFVKIIFTNGIASAYKTIDGGNPSNGIGYLYPAAMFDENFTFDTLYRANSNSYGDSISDFSADFSLVRGYISAGVGFYTSSNVSGTSTITKTQSSGYSGHWVVSGSLGDSYYQNSDRFYVRECVVDDKKWNLIYKNLGGNSYIGTIFMFCYQTISGFGGENEFREYVRKILAYYGMFFADGVLNDAPENEEMTTAGLHLGIVDENGITHGQYTTGDQNPTAPNYTWEDPMDDTPWTPGGGGGDDSELPSDPNLYNSYAASGFGIALKYYALRRTDLDDLYAWVYQYMDYSLAVVAATAAGDPYESEFNRLYPDAAAWHAYVCDRAGHGVYPTDNIVGIMAFPFDLTGSAAGYRMGAWDTSQVYNHFDLVPGAQTLTGLAVTGDGYKIISLGSGAVEFPALHGDYRDTAPYTRIDLQIPYHGTVALEPGVWIGHTLTVEAVVDLMCGSSVAVILRDGAPMMTVPGQMGISVPITRDNVSQTANTFMAQSNAYQSSVLGAVSGFAQGVLRYVGGAAGAVSAGLTGDLPGVVTGALGTIAGGWGTLTAARQEQIQIRQQQYDMQHIVTGRMVSGGGSPACNAKLGTRCRLVWHYPRVLPGSNAADYPALAGHACSCTDVIGAFTGFVQFGAVDLSGLTCTDTEKAVILQALQAGVYI